MSTFITDTAIEGQTKLFVNKPATYDEPIRDISPIKAQPEPLNHSLASRPKLEEKSLRELKPVVSSKVFPTSQRAEGSKQLNKLEMPKFTSPSKHSLKPSSTKSHKRMKSDDAFFKNPAVERIKEVKAHMNQLRSSLETKKKQTEVALKEGLKDKREIQTLIDLDQQLKTLNFLKAYDDEIVKKFDKIYQTKPRNVIDFNIKNLEKRKVFSKQIEKEQERIENEKKELNKRKYEIQQLDKRIMELNTITYGVDGRMEDNSKLEAGIEKLKALLKEADRKANMEELSCEKLEHVRARTKDDLQVTLKRNIEQEEEIRKKEAETNIAIAFQGITNNRLTKLKYEESRILKKKQGIEKNIDPLFESILDDEVSFFEDKIAMREIRRHEEELKLKQEKADEIARQEAKEKEEHEQNQKLRKERLYRLERERLLNEKIAEFNDLRDVTHVNHINEIFDYYEDLIEKANKLEGERQRNEKTIENIQEEIEERKKRLESIKFENRNGIDSPMKKKPTDKKPQEADLNKLFAEDEDFAQERIALHNKTIELQDVEQSLGKIEKLLSEVYIIMGRVIHQVFRGKKTLKYREDRENAEIDLDTHLSQVGIALEKMITIIVRKRKAFRIESINTDGTHQKPPDFLGLNTKRLKQGIEIDPELKTYALEDELPSAEREEFFYLEKKRKDYKKLLELAKQGKMSEEELQTALEQITKEELEADPRK